MRSINTFLYTLAVVIFFLSASTYAVSPQYVRRDDISASSGSGPTTAASTGTTAASTTDGPSSTGTMLSSITSHASVMASTGTTSLVSAAMTTLIPTATGTASNSSDPNALPLQPKLSPGLGIAGAILLISGAVFTVIGIKNKMLYVFLSTAYLTSLGVTVLIVYVMNPPVTDAVQGAFFVGAFMTGIIFGALALIFIEVTEGLGCLLGGFCLSMWFLALSPGGLIKSTTGKIIFICLMCFAGYSLSFSHYTRNYGLIFCISFAGATATVLGIDCFSRAGLKEFWLYIWNLNNNKIFPLNTNTYPMTRGIKVEIAGIVIIFLFGLISQFRIWKLVKEHREKKDAARLEEAESNERLEAELGRKIERGLNKERAQWEEVYGGGKGTKDDPDSAIGSRTTVTRTSLSVREAPSASIELGDIDRRKSSESAMSKIPGVTVNVIGDDDAIQTIDANGNLITPSNMSPRDSATSFQDQLAGKRSIKRSSAPPPVVLPLPFKIPSGANTITESNSGSLSPVPEVDDTENRQRKRRSINSLLQPRPTSQMFRNNSTESSEALIMNTIEDDRASSIAATLDDIHDRHSLPALSEPSSPVKENYEPYKILKDGTPRLVFSTSEQSITPPTENGSEAERLIGGAFSSSQSLALDMDQGQDGQMSKSPSISGKRLSAAGGESNVAKSQVASENPDSDLVKGPLAEHLPSSISKAALTYRTNEWAKHLEAAETPEADEFEEPPSPGVQVSMGIPEPIRVKTSLSPSPPTAPSPVTEPSPLSERTHSEILPGISEEEPSNAAAPATEETRTPESQLQRTSSSKNKSRMSLLTSFAKRSSRNASAPLLGQTLVEDIDTPNTAAPLPTNTLLSKRDDIMRKKLSTVSFTPYSSSTPALNSLAPSDSASVRNVSLEEDEADNISLFERKQLIDMDNIPLAQRKKMIQRQSSQQSQNSQHRQSSLPTMQAAQQLQHFDSHQPRRSSGFDKSRQDTMLANWRQSLQQDLQKPQPFVEQERRRIPSYNDVRQMQAQQQQQQKAVEQRKSVEPMRRASRTDMLSAHKEAMRRLQASASHNPL